ncbi:MAG: hypothetical protein WD696_10535 [Bryobacteraceae bacterium]
MHQVVSERLEDVLRSFASNPQFASLSPQIRMHLDGCEPCRNEVQVMAEMNLLFANLRAPEEIVAPASFAVKVLDSVGTRGAASIWTFLFEPLFARRVAFASLVFLALLGGVLMSGDENEYQHFEPSVESIIAEQNEVIPDIDHDRDVILVNLAHYNQDDWQ